jgi:ABC-type thiamin/hydroxymethylpyrimidine transport system permease subunit
MKNMRTVQHNRTLLVEDLETHCAGVFQIVKREGLVIGLHPILIGINQGIGEIIIGIVFNWRTMGLPPPLLALNCKKTTTEINNTSIHDRMMIDD